MQSTPDPTTNGILPKSQTEKVEAERYRRIKCPYRKTLSFIAALADSTTTRAEIKKERSVVEKTFCGDDIYIYKAHKPSLWTVRGLTRGPHKKT